MRETLLCTRIDLPGNRDGLLAQGRRLRVPIEEHQNLAKPRQGACPFRSRPVGRGDRHRPAVRLERAGAVTEHPQSSPKLLTQDPRPERIGGAVHAPVGLLAMCDRTAVVGRQVGGQTRFPQQLDAVEPGHALRVFHVIPEVERAFELVQCRSERVCRHCCVGCLE